MTPWLVALLGLVLATTIATAKAETSCPLPDAMALRDISLPAARRQVTDDHRLVVLTFGGVHSAETTPEALGMTYPGRLKTALTEALPGVDVKLVNQPPPGKNSSDVPPVLPGLIAGSGASLVIWGPGGRDVAARLGLETFSIAVDAGIQAVRRAGADLILLDTTFFPSPSRMAAIEDYRDRLLALASSNHVPLFRRHAMMRQWSEDGTLNLAASDPEEREQVVRHLYSCVARELAEPIAAAVR